MNLLRVGPLPVLSAGTQAYSPYCYLAILDYFRKIFKSCYDFIHLHFIIHSVSDLPSHVYLQPQRTLTSRTSPGWLCWPCCWLYCLSSSCGPGKTSAFRYLWMPFSNFMLWEWITVRFCLQLGPDSWNKITRSRHGREPPAVEEAIQARINVTLHLCNTKLYTISNLLQNFF